MANAIPTAADWLADPSGSLTNALAVAAATTADAQSSGDLLTSILESVSPQILTAAAPIAGALVSASPLGPAVGMLVAAGLTAAAADVPKPATTLSPAQQAALSAVIQVGITAAASKVKTP